MDTLAVFRSRNQTMLFANLLEKKGVKTRIITTPRSLGYSCGLSVRFLRGHLGKAREVLGELKMDSFVGFFAINDGYLGGSIKPL